VCFKALWPHGAFYVTYNPATITVEKRKKITQLLDFNGPWVIQDQNDSTFEAIASFCFEDG